MSYSPLLGLQLHKCETSGYRPPGLRHCPFPPHFFSVAWMISKSHTLTSYNFESLLPTWSLSLYRRSLLSSPPLTLDVLPPCCFSCYLIHITSVLSFSSAYMSASLFRPWLTVPVTGMTIMQNLIKFIFPVLY